MSSQVDDSAFDAQSPTTATEENAAEQPLVDREANLSVDIAGASSPRNNTTAAAAEGATAGPATSAAEAACVSVDTPQDTAVAPAPTAGPLAAAAQAAIDQQQVDVKENEEDRSATRVGADAGADRVAPNPAPFDPHVEAPVMLPSDDAAVTVASVVSAEVDVQSPTAFSAPPDEAGAAVSAAVGQTIEDASATLGEAEAPPLTNATTATSTAAEVEDAAAPVPPRQAEFEALNTQVAAAEAMETHAWVIDFGDSKAKPKRKMTKKEKDAIKESRLRSQANANTTTAAAAAAPSTKPLVAGDGGGGLGADSEGNAVVSQEGTGASSALQVVQLDGLADRAALIPTDLTTTRADLEARLVLRLPRFLCVNKQYPRGCGIASLTSVYNYLYSWLGESAVGASRAPHSQEEIMSILGFEPPFGEIAWGPFTGNATLIRWFHALNRHFGLRGKAYILYKVHGSGKTTHLYPDNAAALTAVKAALRDPHCALIYHCHNHYMVPIGYQEIPQAQTDFLKPTVPSSSCDTTLFIGEVSRGRHEAMYARKWEQIVKDLECKSPFFYNIRHPEQGVQRREPKKKKAATTESAAAPPDAAAQTHTKGGDGAGQDEMGEAAAACASAALTPPTTLFIPMPASLRGAEARAEAETAEEVAAFSVEDANAGKSQVEAAEALQALPTTPTTTTTDAATRTVTGGRNPATPPIEGGESQKVPSSEAPTQQSATAARAVSEEGADVTARRSAEPPEPPASPVTLDAPHLCSPREGASLQNTEGGERQRGAEGSSADAAVAAAAASSAPPPPVTAATKAAKAQPTTTAAAAPAPPKKERGNLHCFIIFRNDMVEERLERYEDAPTMRSARGFGASASSSSSEGSSSSDEDDV